MSIYQQWGVEPIINVSGSVTRLGGAPMPKAVLDAFCAAAHDAVPLDELQAAASNVIAEATGCGGGHRHERSRRGLGTRNGGDSDGV